MATTHIHTPTAFKLLCAQMPLLANQRSRIKHTYICRIMALGALLTELFYSSKEKTHFTFFVRIFFACCRCLQICTRLVDVKVLRKCVEQKQRCSLIPVLWAAAFLSYIKSIKKIERFARKINFKKISRREAVLSKYVAEPNTVYILFMDKLQCVISFHIISIIETWNILPFNLMASRPRFVRSKRRNRKKWKKKEHGIVGFYCYSKAVMINLLTAKKTIFSMCSIQCRLFDPHNKSRREKMVIQIRIRPRQNRFTTNDLLLYSIIITFVFVFSIFHRSLSSSLL